MPLAAGASAAGLRKLCEDVPDISQEPSNIEGLLRIGEVTPLCLFPDFGFMLAIGRVLGLLFSDVHSDSAPKRWIGTLQADGVVLLVQQTLDKTFVSGDHYFRVPFYRVFMGLQEVHAVQLSLQEEEDVMCAVGRVLSTVTSSIDVNSALERLLKPTHAAMETLVGDFSSLVEVVLHCLSCQSGPSFDHLCLSLSLSCAHCGSYVQLETDSEGSLRLHSAAYAASLEAGIRAVHR